MTDCEQYLNRIEIALHKEGLALTPKRIAFFSAFFKLTDFVEGEDFWLALKLGGQVISRATVFKLLQMLSLQGFAERKDCAVSRRSLYKPLVFN